MNQETAEDSTVDIYTVTEGQNRQVKQNKIKMRGHKSGADEWSVFHHNHYSTLLQRLQWIDEADEIVNKPEISKDYNGQKNGFFYKCGPCRLHTGSGYTAG